MISRLWKYLISGWMLLLVLPLHAQETPGYIVDAAVTAVNIAIPDKGQPNGWSHSTLPATNDSSLGCILAEGGELSAEVIPYVVRLQYPDGVYNVHVADTGEIVQLCDSKFPEESLIQQPTPTPTPLPEGFPTPTPVDTLICTITPSGTFANLRDRPSTDGALIKIMYPNETFTVSGRSGDWYFSERGWAFFDVVDLGGNCDNLPALSPEQAAEQSNYVCPPSFFGYVQPRIVQGESTAQVIRGNLPNRLRAEPTTDAELIGDIQPGRVIDEVLSGPACNNGIVWWEVDFDGARGWTAESDFSLGEYFLEPADGAPQAAVDSVDVVEQPAPPAPVEQAAPGNAPTGDVITTANAALVSTLETLPVDSATAVTWSPDGTRIAVENPQGVIVFDYPETSVFQVIAQGRANDIPNVFAFNSDGQYLAIGAGDGSIQVHDFSTNTTTPLAENHTSQITDLVFHPTQNLLVSISGGTDEVTADWTLKRWDLTTGSIGGAPITLNFSFPFPLTDVAYSADGAFLGVVGETTTTPNAALWTYDAADGAARYSVGLLPMEGFSFISPVPANSPLTGQFFIGNDGDVNLVDVAGSEITALYDGGDFLVTTVAANPVETSDILTISNASPGAFSGMETVSFFAAGNVTAPAASLTLTALDLDYRPDGTRLAVVSVEGRVLLLGVGAG